MTQGDKELLLKDLCARTVYDTVVNVDGNDVYLRSVDTFGDCIEVADYCNNVLRIDEVKPYLRPMSSMTDEEDKEFSKVVFDSQNIDGISASTYVSDWLISKQFDVRGLIEKGLAIEAPKGMYEK